MFQPEAQSRNSGATPIGEAVGVRDGRKAVTSSRIVEVRVALPVFRMSTAARMDMPPSQSRGRKAESRCTLVSGKG